MRAVLLSAAVGVLFVAAASSASAQYNGGFYQGRSDNPNGPTVSPYLNLLNNNQLSAVTSYQSLVKPLIDQQSAINRQGNSLQQLQQQVNTQRAPGGAGGRATGHATYFMNYSHYYPPKRR
jgi:hypothetical protein